MKNKILIIISVIIATKSYAQYPCTNEISTNPLNPINSQLPSKKNTFFNWQDSIYSVQPINTDCIRGNQMESPFYKIDNLEGLRDSKDMKWIDGWELIRRGFGLTDQNTYTTDPVPNAYLILYNKYTGILRVLLKVCRGTDYNAAKITLSFNSLSQIKTDLLELSRGSISAIDKKYSTTEYSAGSKYVNDNTKWFYGDFPMTYDPCTCTYKSKLTIISNLIASSQISIEGGITGDIYTKDVAGKAQLQKDGSFGWKDFSGLVNGKVNTIYNSVNGFVTATQGFATNIGNVDTVNKKSALDNLGNFLKNNQFLKAGLNAVPWLKSAVGLIDIFTGGGKTSSGPQEIKLLPLSVNLSVKLNGTISTANPYHSIIFTNPGSKDVQLDPDVYPYYNEVMGVFNLIKPPVVFRGTTSTACYDVRRSYQSSTVYNFRFDADSFFYVLNPAPRLTIQNMQGAILVKATKDVNNTPTTNMANASLNSSFPVFEGKDAITGEYIFRSDYFDMKCLDRQILKYVKKNSLCSSSYTSNHSWWNINYDTLFLKLMINLKRNNATSTTQNILVVLTYPVRIVNNILLYNTPTFVTCDSLILPAATSTFVNTFCNSTTYNNLDRQSRIYIDSISLLTKIEKDGIVVYPNPNSGLFTVKLKEQDGLLDLFYITDILGRRVFSSNQSNVNLNSNGLIRQLSVNLKNGIYILTAITSKGRLKTRFVITK